MDDWIHSSHPCPRGYDAHLYFHVPFYVQGINCPMSVNDWVYEAVEKHPNGSSLREVQRYIDEHHFEELAIDTIQKALQQLAKAERISQEEDSWKVAKRTSKEDAMKKLFR